MTELFRTNSNMCMRGGGREIQSELRYKAGGDNLYKPQFRIIRKADVSIWGIENYSILLTEYTTLNLGKFMLGSRLLVHHPEAQMMFFGNDTSSHVLWYNPFLSNVADLWNSFRAQNYNNEFKDLTNSDKRIFSSLSPGGVSRFRGCRIPHHYTNLSGRYIK